MEMRIKITATFLACIFIVLLHADNNPEQALPADFGRTHFIVGMSPDDIHLLRESTEQADSSYQGSTYRKAYFSPDDGLKKILIEHLDNERQSIKIAVFQFTDLDIARAIRRAHERGVAIEIITDPLCLQDKFNKITWLSQAGLSIYIYNPDASKTTLSNKMHHKFVIFGKNIDSKQLVWIGSFNFTKSADIANQESVVVLDDHHIVDQFKKQYLNLKERALKLKDFAKNHFIIQAWQPGPIDLKKTSHKRTSVAHMGKTVKHKKDHSREITAA
jgi:phosphatidylserine/phosphatidylglycerophosphate/cardiolipin synthase-like enzyme